MLSFLRRVCFLSWVWHCMFARVHEIPVSSIYSPVLAVVSLHFSHCSRYVNNIAFAFVSTTNDVGTFLGAYLYISLIKSLFRSLVYFKNLNSFLTYWVLYFLYVFSFMYFRLYYLYLYSGHVKNLFGTANVLILMKSHLLIFFFYDCAFDVRNNCITQIYKHILWFLLEVLWF